uniref:NXPE family member 4-like n=1 Tax=Saccoglossus kowalevskii TaxID=10224 RepID=A0ABM0LYB6_SACKO|nr:PREDICTED: NXPE family member 4-like [Saccoglossus kowalevskii]
MNQADTFEDNINHPHISKMTDDVRFPYKKYTEFAMEWKGIVDEYEWMYSNLKREIGTSKTPFVIGNENFSLTSTVKSRVYVYGKRKIFKKGDTVHIVVEAYDKYGNARKKGGDFLQAIMSNKKLVKSTAGRVLDYGNGTYSVYFYAAWAGQASIDVIKPFSREFILYMNNVLRHKELRIPRDGDFGDGVNTYKGVCYLIHDRRWENMCTYENKNSLGQTVLVCDKPKDPLQCKDIVNVTAYTTYLHRVASEDVAGADYIFKE